MMRWLPLVLLTTMACKGTDDVGNDDRIDEILALTGDATSGSTVYDGSCQACHGDDGTGATATVNLVEEVPGLTDEGLLEVVLDGRNGMPSFDGVIQSQGMADVLAYFREEFGG